MQLMNGTGYGHQQVQSVMNKQKKSVQLETISIKKSDGGVQGHYDRNASAKEGRDHQIPLERVRESSVHVILK